jgi:hypothetical protein
MSGNFGRIRESLEVMDMISSVEIHLQQMITHMGSMVSSKLNCVLYIY